MTSLAAVMSKPDSRGDALAAARPGRSRSAGGRGRSCRARASRGRGAGSSAVSPKWRRLSIAAASRLWAAVIAWKSPVNWRLIVFDGSSRLAPPPVAPPLRPKTGPIDGCRSARTARLPILRSPWARPIDVVVFPSPAGRRRDRRDQDQLARAAGPAALERLEADLRLVAAVGLEVLGGDAEVAGDLGDRSESDSASCLDIARYSSSTDA